MESEATINFKGLAEAAKICKYFLTTDKNLEIHLNSDEFRPNEKAKGMITFRTETAVKPAEIRVEIKGAADTTFYVTNAITTKNTTADRTHYYFTETYLNYQKILYEPLKESDELEAGNHEFPFEFTIPEDAPPSMDEGQGKVRYSIKASVETPWTIKSEAKAEFIVLPYLNLNAYSKLDEPRISKIEKGRLLSSKQITATVSIPKTGYAPGEVIPIKVEKNKQSVLSISLPVPELLPTLEDCANITLEYDVIVEIQTNAYVSRTSKTSLPIIIGTIPLKAKK
uniref:Arrestin C-terminal-like domain-containing protein n=1 Tax=Panagrolaimus superbus TaxID=310955 RepID=A0A914XY31_9BILA